MRINAGYVPLHWLPDETLVNGLVATLHINKAEISYFVSSFVGYSQKHKRSLHNIDLAFSGWVKRGLAMRTHKQHAPQRPPVNSGNEGFFMASEDFAKRYREGGFEQYHPDKPWTWKRPDETMLPGYEAYANLLKESVRDIPKQATCHEQMEETV